MSHRTGRRGSTRTGRAARVRWRRGRRGGPGSARGVAGTLVGVARVAGLGVRRHFDGGEPGLAEAGPVPRNRHSPCRFQPPSRTSGHTATGTGSHALTSLKPRAEAFVVSRSSTPWRRFPAGVVAVSSSRRPAAVAPAFEDAAGVAGGDVLLQAQIAGVPHAAPRLTLDDAIESAPQEPQEPSWTWPPQPSPPVAWVSVFPPLMPTPSRPARRRNASTRRPGRTPRRRSGRSSFVAPRRSRISSLATQRVSVLRIDVEDLARLVGVEWIVALLCMP